MSFKGSMKEILEERRKALGPNPPLEDLICLREGRISAAKRERILEQASTDPDLARQLFDVLNFPELPLPEEAPEMDLDGQLQATLDRLGLETETSSPLDDTSFSLHLNRKQLSGLAAVWLLTLVTAVLLPRWITHSHENLPMPKTNLQPVELVSTHQTSRGAESVKLSDTVTDLVVSLNVPELSMASSEEMFHLLLNADSIGEPAEIRELSPVLAGTFVLTIPRSMVAVGNNVWILNDESSNEVARFQVHIELAE